MLEMRSLRYFVAVAEELHFGRAAEKLHIVQPALSMQIRALETQIGTPLFDRAKRKVSLTVAGTLMLAEAREALRQVERTETIGRLAGRGEIGRIELGYVGSVAFSDVLPSTISLFRREYPLVELHLSELPDCRQLEALDEGQLDLGFVRTPSTAIPDGIVLLPVRRERLFVALHRDHALVAQETIPTLALAEQGFVSHSPITGAGLLGHVNSVCRRAGFEPRVAQVVPQIAMVVSLVAAGLGVALVPESFCQMHLDSVVYRPLADGGEVSELALAYRKSEHATAVLAFIQETKQWAAGGDKAPSV